MALAIAMGLVLAGCATQPPAPPPPSPAPSKPIQLVAPPIPPRTPLPARKPAAPARTAKATDAPRKTAVLPPPPPPVPAPTRFDPERLIGLSADETERLLGQPIHVDEVPPARIWRYAQGDCVLRIHMFMEMKTRSFRTLSYELNSTGVKPDVDDECRDWLDIQAAGKHGRGG